MGDADKGFSFDCPGKDPEALQTAYTAFMGYCNEVGKIIAETLVASLKIKSQNVRLGRKGSSAWTAEGRERVFPILHVPAEAPVYANLELAF